MKVKNILGAVALRLTPWPVVKRQVSEISGAFTRTAQRIREAKNVVTRQQDRAQAENPQLTPEQLFEMHYQAGSWTERELSVRSGRLRVTKWIWLVAAALATAGAVRLAIVWPWAAMLVPAVMVAFATVCLAKAALGGWLEYQIYTRSMVTFREFLGRPEFFRFWLF
jgi:hypothetical protein